MHDLDETVFAYEGIKAAKWADVPAPSVFLGEEVKKKDRDKKKPAKAKAKDDTSVCDTDRTYHLKCSQGEDEREAQSYGYDPVADVAAEGESMLFLFEVEFSSKSGGCLCDNVDRADR